MRRLVTNPKIDGFRMPGEFEPHRGTYMIWPERPDNWRLGASLLNMCLLKLLILLLNMNLLQWLYLMNNMLMLDIC